MIDDVVGIEYYSCTMPSFIAVRLKNGLITAPVCDGLPCLSLCRELCAEGDAPVVFWDDSKKQRRWCAGKESYGVVITVIIFIGALTICVE